MLKLETSTEFVCVSLDGPYADLTAYPVYMAIVPDPSDEPDTSLYQPAAWLNGEVAYKPAGLAEGLYFVYVRITAGTEDVRLPSGRLRVGDPRK